MNSLIPQSVDGAQHQGQNHHFRSQKEPRAVHGEPLHLLHRNRSDTSFQRQVVRGRRDARGQSQHAFHAEPEVLHAFTTLNPIAEVLIRIQAGGTDALEEQDLMILAQKRVLIPC